VYDRESFGKQSTIITATTLLHGRVGAELHSKPKSGTHMKKIQSICIISAWVIGGLSILIIASVTLYLARSGGYTASPPYWPSVPIVLFSGPILGMILAAITLALNIKVKRSLPDLLAATGPLIGLCIAEMMWVVGLLSR
jgi:hypothetical protein